MDAVADDLHMGSVIGSSAHNAGSAVGEGRHGVEQVGGVGSAVGEAGLGLLVGGAGVGDGNGAQLAGLADEVQRAGQLGGHVDQADVLAGLLIQALEHVEIGVDDVLLGLGTLLGLVEEGAFHVHAAQHGAFTVLMEAGLGSLEYTGQDLLVKGHGGAHEGGNALAALVAADLHHILGGGVAEVAAGSAVDVNVHKAGGNVLAGGVDDLVALQSAGGSNLNDTVALQLDVSLHEAALIGENMTILDNHRKTSPS